MENNPAKSSEALAYIRTLYAMEKEIADTSDIAVSLKQARAAPIVKQFGEWLEIERRSLLPKSPFGEAVPYACNMWSTLDRSSVMRGSQSIITLPNAPCGHSRLAARIGCL